MPLLASSNNIAMTMMETLVYLLLAFGVGSNGILADYGLQYNYYHGACPQAEALISKLMADIIKKDSRVPARMIRMHFHDCFVRGCDGSVLLSSTPDNPAERDAPPNNPSLQGFEVIDRLKDALEYQCPGIVSCADTLAYAARESVWQSGHFEYYPVRGGRKDGTISRSAEATQNLPPPFFTVDLLLQAYNNKGLSLEDMVALSGAHSIGVSHCSSLFGRQINFNNTGVPDPTLDPNLASTLRQECPANSNDDPIIVMDRFSPTVLDNKYYLGLLQNRGLFTSDQTLLTNELTRRQVVSNAEKPYLWEKRFVQSFVKMGEIEVKTGDEGEIRKKCAFVNY